jgi:hypothetical protein
MDAYDIGIKIPAAGALKLKDFIPVFHRFIQTRALDDLLIDVADYSHVHQGPGVILVCHGAIYGIDEEDGRQGLLYRRRRDTGGTFSDKLIAILRGTLVAAKKLEDEPSARIRFRASELEISVNDRLRAPNTKATYDALSSHFAALAERAYGKGNYELAHLSEARRRLGVRIVGRGNHDVAGLLARVANEASR